MLKKLVRTLPILLAALVALPVLAQERLEIPPPAVGRTDSSLTRRIPDYVDWRTLAANVSETHTVPAWATPGFVFFGTTCSVFTVRRGASAAIPAGDVTDGTAPEINPTRYFIPAGVTQLTLVAPGACQISLAFNRN